MNILIIADPLESFKIYKDTTFVMMRELQRRGHRLAACEPQHLSWRSGGVVTAGVRPLRLTGEADRWFEAEAARPMALKDFDAILMRKDPPFDSEYFYATHLLEQAQREQRLAQSRSFSDQQHRRRYTQSSMPGPLSRRSQ